MTTTQPKNNKKFGDTELGQGLGCAFVILAVAVGGGIFFYLIGLASSLNK
jgi:hypothetical protein